MQPFKVGQRVTGIVERVLPFGVFVRLKDNSPGYIRRRELALDADIEPSKVVQVGETIEAVVVDVGDQERVVELSHRAVLPDPWIDFVRTFREGDVIRAVVRSVARTGVYVRVIQGIDGYIPLDELAMWEVQRASDLLWVDDNVEAMIMRIDASRKHVTLSIRAWMEKRSQVHGLLHKLEGKSESYSLTTNVISVETEPRELQLDLRELDRIGPILVVDDQTEIRISLTQWLEDRGFHVVRTKTLQDAIEHLQRGNWRVLFLDLSLGSTDGLELLRNVRASKRRRVVCLMSNARSLATRAEEIASLNISQIFVKPLEVDEIERFLLRIARGENATRLQSLSPNKPENRPSFYDHFVVERTDASSSARLGVALENITQLINAQKGIIFSLDPESQLITVLEEVGILPLNEEAVLGLDNSPVEDVVREAAPIVENNVSSRAKAKFSRLLELLEFESCVGVPIQVYGETNHCAFFFHRAPGAFSPFRLRDARAGALLIAALLERDLMNQQINSLSRVLLSGDLAEGFIHEISNKIWTLELRLHDLQDLSGKGNLNAALLQLNHAVMDLVETTRVFQELPVDDYERSNFSVNDVVYYAVQLMKPTADLGKVKLAPQLASHMPKLRQGFYALQQAFVNLMLNAVQHMIRKPDELRVLYITSSMEDEPFMQIRFSDTGPGIHKQLWKRIFSVGYSTRGGSGLGLFLANGFIRSLGGRVLVEDSIIPLGTTFLVELPMPAQDSMK